MLVSLIELFMVAISCYLSTVLMYRPIPSHIQPEIDLKSVQFHCYVLYPVELTVVNDNCVLFLRCQGESRDLRSI